MEPDSLRAWLIGYGSHQLLSDFEHEVHERSKKTKSISVRQIPF